MSQHKSQTKLIIILKGRWSIYLYTFHSSLKGEIPEKNVSYNPSMNSFIKFLVSKSSQNISIFHKKKIYFFDFYLGSWRHLSVKIFGRRCSLKNFRDETYIYIELIYQISAQSDTWNITGGWGQVLAPFT